MKIWLEIAVFGLTLRLVVCKTWFYLRRGKYFVLCFVHSKSQTDESKGQEESTEGVKGAEDHRGLRGLFNCWKPVEAGAEKSETRASAEKSETKR